MIDYDLAAKRSIVIYDNIELFPFMNGMSLEDIYNLIIEIEKDKTKRDEMTDSLLSYDDEIMEIIPLDEQELMDISVSGDNLFYANGILTKNSFGLPATADVMLALIATDDLKNLNQMMIKQLKNRYSDPEIYKKFIIGVDKSRMRLYNLENSAQESIQDSGAVFDNTPSARDDGPRYNTNYKFNKGSFEDFK